MDKIKMEDFFKTICLPKLTSEQNNQLVAEIRDRHFYSSPQNKQGLGTRPVPFRMVQSIERFIGSRTKSHL